MNRKVFYARVRERPFGGVLTQRNVDGMDAILDYWYSRHADKPDIYLAYILATAFHETGGKMGWDVREIGKGRGRPYGKPDKRSGTNNIYYGRGPVQITWYDNYKKFQDIMDVPLVKNPDLALRKDIAMGILIEGSIHGAFRKDKATGKPYRLATFFNNEDTVDTPELRQRAYKARDIINGKYDKAKLIASYTMAFLAALCASNDEVESATALVALDEEGMKEPIDEGKSLLESKTVWGGLLAGSTGIGSTVLGHLNNPYALAGIALVIIVGVALVIYGRKEIKYLAGY